MIFSSCLAIPSTSDLCGLVLASSASLTNCAWLFPKALATRLTRSKSSSPILTDRFPLERSATIFGCKGQKMTCMYTLIHVNVYACSHGVAKIVRICIDCKTETLGVWPPRSQPVVVLVLTILSQKTRVLRLVARKKPRWNRGAVLGLYPDQDQNRVTDLVNDHEYVEHFHGPPFLPVQNFSGRLPRKNRKLKREN